MRSEYTIRGLGIVLLGTGLALAAGIAVPGRAPEVTRTARRPQPAGAVRRALARPPIPFEANRGQADPALKFLARGPGYSLGLAPTEARIALPHARPVRLRLRNANARARAVGRAPLPGKVHYYRGTHPSTWIQDVPTFARVECADVYPGIDLVYYDRRTASPADAREGRLEYDFRVAPGADPAAIGLEVAGAAATRLDPVTGDLVLKTEAGELRQHRPVAYQLLNGRRVGVPCEYRLAQGREWGNGGMGEWEPPHPHSPILPLVRLAVGTYDKTKPLVIDPVLSYSTYFGGTLDDEGFGTAVDGDGNMYLSGWTNSPDFPSPSGAPRSPQGADVFVAKLNPAGDTLLYTTFLGGNSDDRARTMDLDAQGNAVVAGWSTSSDFPFLNGFQHNDTFNISSFVCRLDAQGRLTYATNFGLGTTLTGAAVDAQGQLAICGTATLSGGVPLHNPLQGEFKGSADYFVAKFNAAGNGLIFSTFLGGSGQEYFGTNVQADCLAMDDIGNVYVIGSTSSLDFPVANAFQPQSAGYDTFVTALAADGSSLLYSSYLGGSELDDARGIAVDANRAAYLIGDTLSADFPVKNALDPTPGSNTDNSDAYVAKVNPGGTLAYATYLGGSSLEYGQAIAVDLTGAAYVVGATYSDDFPLFRAIQGTRGGSFDLFVAKISPAGDRLLYSTYLGGQGSEVSYGGTSLFVASDRSVLVGGTTDSENYPTVHPFQATHHGRKDAFMARISPVAPSAPVSLTATLQDGPAVALAWEHPLAGQIDFQVERKVGTGQFQVLIAATPGTTLTDTSVEAGKTYTYQVRAVDRTDIEGASGPSNPASVTVPVAVRLTGFTLPAALRSGQRGTATVTLSRNAVTRVVVELTCSRRDLLDLPRSVALRPGQRTLRFDVRAKVVRRGVQVPVRASFGDDTLTRRVNLRVR